jgi:hypothetical protein
MVSGHTMGWRPSRARLLLRRERRDAELLQAPALLLLIACILAALSRLVVVRCRREPQ